MYAMLILKNVEFIIISGQTVDEFDFRGPQIVERM